MRELTPNDLRYVAQRLPRDIRSLLKAHPNNLFLAGGFIRATIAGEEPNDIDMFGFEADWLRNVAASFAARRGGARQHKSSNAVTLLTPNRLAVQFITRWTFGDPTSLVGSFDFTVCQAAIWRNTSGEWRSMVSDDFYIDLAARRLVYTNPVREEEAGGSMLRVIKYVKRGYSIQVSSLGQVIARLARAVKPTAYADSEQGHGNVITGLLREVDPSLTVDGFELVDDHKPVDGFAADDA